jgi:transposase
MVLDQFITLEKAAKRLNMGVDDVQDLVESGKMRGAKLPDGSLAVSEKSVKKREPTVSSIPKEELPEYKKHAHLQGIGISISEASRKYEIGFSTLQRWATRGYVTRLGQEKNRVLIDEADVAYCAEIYRTRGGQGKWLFQPDGTPYTPTSLAG